MALRDALSPLSRDFDANVLPRYVRRYTNHVDVADRPELRIPTLLPQYVGSIIEHVTITDESCYILGIARSTGDDSLTVQTYKVVNIKNI